MKIYAQVKDFSGVRNGVRFVEGVGETNDATKLGWFISHGYRVPLDDSLEKCDNSSLKSVEKCDEVVEETPVVDDSEFVEINKLADEEVVESITTDEPTEPNFDAMTPFELREWAKEHGLGLQIGNTRNKEKLLAIIRG